MEQLGLPLAFGKQQPAQQPKAESSTQQGAASGQNQRGNNQRGRRNRGSGNGNGRGRQQHPHVQDAHHVLNEGVKRPFTNPSPLEPPVDVSGSSLHPSLPPAPVFDQPQRGGYQHRGRGGGRGGGHGSHEVPERGFFKESFCEDPWAELLRERARQRS